MMSIFCTKAVSIFLYVWFLTKKKGINVSEGCKNLNAFLHLYICSLYCILVCTVSFVASLVILNFVVLSEAQH